VAQCSGSETKYISINYTQLEKGLNLVDSFNLAQYSARLFAIFYPRFNLMKARKSDTSEMTH
jgi:hypothetical protein